MIRTIVQTNLFSRFLDDFIEKKKLSLKDFEEFEKLLLKNPKLGDVIPGLSGLRKVRLKGSHMGKRGGFRVDYLDLPEVKKLYLIVIYPKNVKQDLSSEEKKSLKKIIELIKEEELKNG